jgi:uncharacterized YigZ family protein
MDDSQNDSFLTPAHPDKAELKIKGSRFIASIYPISSDKEAWDVIKEISADYRDATHNCYAFQLDSGDQRKFRCSDAGEPSGTAGSAILSAIEHSGITNVVLLVTRYFGGTKLGVGPLRRAYRDSAKAAIEKCGIKTKFHTDRFSFSIPYTSLKDLQQLLNLMQVVTISQQFDEMAKYTVDIRKSLSKEFQEKMKQLLKGKSLSLEKENIGN